MQKTFKEIMEVDAVVGTMYKKNPELRDTKFGYAYKRFYDKNYAPTLKKFQEKLADIAVEFALEDKETSELLKDDKGAYKYSKDGQQKLNKKQREVMEKMEDEVIEVEPYVSPYVPKLSETEFEILKGLVVPTQLEKSDDKPADTGAKKK